ncbi:hypothetical protein CH259_00490 [Rhodococcus sp. 05-2254-4]|nr:hypothetical protein CH259_00490 [Rhodococcus sp. 05-2254-4]OZE47352.1 hypothetical protein CH261_10250 [Rhodococcus sp. 05-2254-3]OZE47651.1 hypothetical protein CH283_18365 [Rhodococcus sp. 05-2254-2]
MADTVAPESSPPDEHADMKTLSVDTADSVIIADLFTTDLFPSQDSLSVLQCTAQARRVSNV